MSKKMMHDYFLKFLCPSDFAPNSQWKTRGAFTLENSLDLLAAPRLKFDILFCISKLTLEIGFANFP